MNAATPPPKEADPLRILVFRYRFLGDTILTVPFLKRLRELHPRAHIAVLVAPTSGELLKNCPYVDELIEHDTTRFHKYDSGPGKVDSFWHLAWQLRKRKFDIAYVLKRSFSSALMAALAGIPKRIGFNTECRGFLLTKTIPFDEAQHEVCNFLNHLPTPYNQAEATKEISFWPTETEHLKAKQLMQSMKDKHKPKVLIHAPAAHPLKMWTAEGWAELIKLLKQADCTIVFSGAPSDKAYYQNIEQLAELKADLNLCEQNNTLRENVAAYGLCDLAICVDSGPMHLAAAVGLPVVAIFGPSDWKRWHPWSNNYEIVTSSAGLDCRPCKLKPTCQEHECLSLLTASDVINAARKFLKR